jgi:DNA-directed RNA polymerase specialized sigma24 family protein
MAVTDLPAKDEELARAAENVPSSMLPPDAQMEGIWEQEWRESIFRAALAKVRQRANPKQYQVFDCCVLQNQRPAEVARMLGLNSAQVYLAKHRLSAAVKRAVKELEAAMGGGPVN